MRRRLAFAAAALSFVILLALLIWQGSFRIPFSPTDLTETIILWSVSTLIFILTVVLAFMLFRASVKVYIDRRRNKEGSRIRSKLLLGALALILAPALFFAVFSGYVLNRHLDTWFNRPSRSVEAALKDLDASYRREAQTRVQAETEWISLLPETRKAAETGRIDAPFFRQVCLAHGIRQLILDRPGNVPMLLYQLFEKSNASLLQAYAKVVSEDKTLGRVNVVAAISTNAALTSRMKANEDLLQRFIDAQSRRRSFYQDTYFRLICLITVFVLFVASWFAQIFSKQISGPISALLQASKEVRRGNLSYRVRVNAMDELATLVRAFNEMTNSLDANARELESRRRFTEAILESIPTGVISLSSDERIERGNRALAGLFPRDTIASAKQLEDLFSPEDLAEIRYLLKRARRTGAAASQLDIHRSSSVMHLAVTVASLEEHRGFVLVLEDTSDLLRAQKSAAWQEVARRVAHEIKNPLTPISLSADRIARQLKRLQLDPDVRAILDECTQTIQGEVQTVKTLVDEFAQFSRFPAAQLVPTDLNDIVESAMAVFEERLDGISVSVDLDRNIPTVLADREQMKRVIVNLIDNAAEAMLQSPVRRLSITTEHTSADTVELSVMDTGSGVSATDKEKLFLPYFSTKARGTGLGLAIVSHIVTEHRGRVRVADNFPTGTRFTVELNPVGVDLNIPAEIIAAQPATLKV